MKNQLENIKMRLEGSETESSLLENPEGTPEQNLEIENMNLQAKVRQYQGEIAQLKLRDREQTQQVIIINYRFFGRNITRMLFFIGK